MTTTITSPPAAFAEVQVNENFIEVSHQAVYAKNAATTSGLTWGYVGGRWGGFAITAGTLSLTASSTNYVVVLISSGVMSVSTSITNWNATSTYARAYKVTTGASSVTAIEDHRAGPAGVQGVIGTGTGLASLAVANVWTANQSVAPVALTDGTTIATDASLSNNFTVTIAGNRTLSNPTNLVAGMWLHWTITQDGTGSRTLAYGSFFKWPGGTAPVLSTAAGSVDTVSAYVSSSTLLRANASLGYA